MGDGAELSQGELAFNVIFGQNQPKLWEKILTDSHANLEAKLYALYGLSLQNRKVFDQLYPIFLAKEGKTKVHIGGGGCTIGEGLSQAILENIRLGKPKYEVSHLPDR